LDKYFARDFAAVKFHASYEFTSACRAYSIVHWGNINKNKNVFHVYI